VKRLAIILAAALLLAAPLAEAGRWGGDPGGGYLVDPRDSRSNNEMSADEAADRARSRHGGRVLSVRSRRDGGSRYYEVKLLKEGQVRIVRIDAGR